MPTPARRTAILKQVEASSLRAEPLAFAIGDTVNVHTRILEGDKERIQIFNGVVIARRGSGTRELFTVRRIVAGAGAVGGGRGGGWETGGRRRGPRAAGRGGSRTGGRRSRPAVGELDLVPGAGCCIVFVGARPRRSTLAGQPHEAVDRAKQAQLT